MTITYEEVSGFRLPATLVVDEKNVGKFEFAFSGCKVKTL